MAAARPSALLPALVAALLAATPGHAEDSALDRSDRTAVRAAYRAWLDSVPAAPAPRDASVPDLVAQEIARFPALEANQGVAVDGNHLYGIGNHALVKLRKDTGERVAAWTGPRGGPIVHFNAGWVEGDRLVLAHSNFPQLPQASSIETHDTRTLAPVASHPLPRQEGSLTWAVRRDGRWWACFANYDDAGTPAGRGNAWTHLVELDDDWRPLRSWLFPAEVRATWGRSACSGGDWGDDGLLYVTGHDAPLLHVLRLPRQGVALELVATIAIPFEGQGWAWDRTRPGERILWGISRPRAEIVGARIPAVE